MKKYGKYPILKISKISDFFKLENMGYISDIYRADIYRANPGLKASDSKLHYDFTTEFRRGL